jgi:hypothetical protein
LTVSGVRLLDWGQLALPGWLPVNAGAAAEVNVQHLQRASARTNHIEMPVGAVCPRLAGKSLAGVR